MAMCGRKGCTTRVPALAVKHQDPYCSTTCCRVDHGIPVEDRYVRKAVRQTAHDVLRPGVKWSWRTIATS